jgi:hypothetical protein
MTELEGGVALSGKAPWRRALSSVQDSGNRMP